MRSIRAFLLRRLVGGTALILALACLVAYLISAGTAQDHFDKNLVDRVQGFVSNLWQIGDEVEFQFSDELMPEYGQEERPAFFQIRFADGEILENSESLGDGDLEVPMEIGYEPVHWSAALPDGRPGRYVAQRMEIHHVYPEHGPDRPEVYHVLMTLARGREDLAAAQRNMLLTSAAFGVLLLGLITSLAWTAVDRALAPAGRLAHALQAARVENPPEQLVVEGLPRELTPMADTANELMQRVGVALDRERRTTADIAHELRTPISELVTVSEVALRHTDDTRHMRRVLSTVRDVAWRMGRSVATLLKLARLESGSETFEHEPIDLGVMMSEVLYTREGQAKERHLTVDGLIDPGEEVRGDGSVLRIIASNLVSNAVHYTPEGGRVVCRMERSGDRWVVIVENDAPELEEHDLAFFAEPFWRKDGARSDRHRSGLGLALSCSLAETGGMRLTFELADDVLKARLSGSDRAPSSRGSAKLIRTRP